MFKNTITLLIVVASSYMTGCATVPMASVEEDKAIKEFSSPSQETAGLYIYRNSNFGGSLKKTISIDGEIIGETAPMTFFYKKIKPGKHSLSTESGFSDDILTLDVKGGLNYYVNQYIKMRYFFGGVGLELVSVEDGKQGVLECGLAIEQTAKQLEANK